MGHSRSSVTVVHFSEMCYAQSNYSRSQSDSGPDQPISVAGAVEGYEKNSSSPSPTRSQSITPYLIIIYTPRLFG